MSGVRAGCARAFVALALGLACAAAAAHAYLQRSEPPPNAVVAQAPSELRLRYSEAVEPAFVNVEVLRDGRPVESLGAAQVDKDGKTIRVEMPAAGDGAPAGYEVRWRIVAKDGHPTQGRFAFRVGVK